MSVKKIGTADITGQRGVNLIERIVLEMGFFWNPTGGVEAGIDGYIEIRDAATGEVFNLILQVQSKATERAFQAETPDSFDYLCDARDLDYWLRGNAPVILVVSRPSTNEAYWVSIKDYFQDTARRKARKVHFDKHQDRFDATCRQRLADLAIPRDTGIYLSPPLKQETLWSNLLEVASFAPKVYVAPTDLRLPSEVWAILSRIDKDAGTEWVLKNKQIISFHNLAESPWREVCDPGAVECFDTSEWAYSSDPDKQREFVWLLNEALRGKLKPEIRYSKEKKCYYFKAGKKDGEKFKTITHSYKSFENNVKRRVFHGYASKADPNRIAYYRHSAFEGRFRRIEDAWFLEITPTYYFTRDGYHLSKWYEERLKGIKRLERNSQVLGQLVMWADYLSKPPGLFSSDPFLTFGALQTFEIEAGVDDKEWLGHEEDENTKKAAAASEEKGLFDL